MSNAITSMVNEKDVENYYRQELTKKFKDIVFSSPFGCDGYGESITQNIRAICEFKDDFDLSKKVNQCKILSQIIYYIKKFEIAGKILPSTIFIGDKDECFTLHTNSVFKYLSMDLDWSIAPSDAHTNLVLINELVNDPNINPHVFTIQDLDEVVKKIKDLTDGVKRLIPITPHNITEVFTYFEKNVLGPHKLTTNQLANLFVQILINPGENYLHPIARRKTIVTKVFNEVPIKSSESFTSFFSHFSNEYTPRQKEELTAVVDRLVEDITRRKQGEFFTPTIWVDTAHKCIASVFGEDWKEKYVVLDPAWGTGNLTRDYKFKELYVSTLNYSDIQTAEQMGYNPEATKFQFDFLNDPYELLPEKLRKVIESGKEIIVLMNPPYGRANEGGRTSTVSKGSADTMVGKQMKDEKIGSCSAQMYAQFLYKVNKLGIKNICFFSTTKILTGTTFNKLRDIIEDKSEFKKGFIIDASEFADVKSWALSFSIFGEKK
jgi:hypothetical protein